MSVGRKIKQLRELRNFTQHYIANELNMSVSGYGKIERDETDISLQKLTLIANVLETDIATIMNFDAKQVFNQLNNKTANGIVQNQHNHNLIGNYQLDEFFSNLTEEIKVLKSDISDLRKNTKA